MFYLAIDKDLQVRTLHPEDAEALFQLVERNRSRLRPWIPPSALPESKLAARKFAVECFLNSLPDSPDARKEYQGYYQELETYIPSLNPPMEMGIWVSDMLAGQIMLARQQDKFTDAEFGYWIDGEKEGQGIITRCVSVLMDYAIDNMGIERFFIGCAADNRRSSAVPERLGYRLRARVPGGEAVGDALYDRVIYEIQSVVWRARRKEFVMPSTASDRNSR